MKGRGSTSFKDTQTANIVGLSLRGHRPQTNTMRRVSPTGFHVAIKKEICATLKIHLTDILANVDPLEACLIKQ